MKYRSKCLSKVSTSFLWFWILWMFSSCSVAGLGWAGGGAPVMSQRTSVQHQAYNPAQHINVLDFGAKGDGKADDTQAFIKAIKASVSASKACYVPKTNQHYVLDNTVRVELRSGQSLTLLSNGATIKTSPSIKASASSVWKLTPSYNEYAMFSLGPAADNKAFPNNFGNNNKIQVEIDGLVFDANSHARGANPAHGNLIVSALDVSAETIHITNCEFHNIIGYGVRTYGVKRYQNTNNLFENVGGRAVAPSTDAYGDAIFTAAVAKDATINIENNDLRGSKRLRRKSRSGITFEFSQHRYNANVINCTVVGFAKAIHVEEPAPSSISVRNSQLHDANYTIAMVMNKQAVLNVYDSDIVIRGTDGVDGGSGGPVINTDGGGTINFYDSELHLNGPRHAYITMVGVKEVKGCTIYAYNKNPYFADGNTNFVECSFYDFGGTERSFFSYVGNNRFRVVNSVFHRGGNVHARGQKVRLDFENARAVSPNVSLIKQ